MHRVRPASHAGSWYSADPEQLRLVISRWIVASKSPKARFAVGPHAGYAYCGAVLGATYGSVDPQVERIFIMGPSHCEYFKGFRTTKFKALDTPLGSVKVDSEVVEHMLNAGVQTLSTKTDIAEHGIEMHLPFVKSVCSQAKVVPLVYGNLSKGHEKLAIDILSQYIDDSTTAFVVSSDFCHWGSRFGYNAYSPIQSTIASLDNYQPLQRQQSLPRAIYQSIKELDHIAMEIASTGDSEAWRRYIEKTGNTICGQEPLFIMLAMVEAKKKKLKFEWLAYDQSSKVHSPEDSSVSYASGVAFIA